MIASALLRDGIHPVSPRGVGRTVGSALIWNAGILAGIVLVLTVIAAIFPTDNLRGALIVAGWHEIDGRLWIFAGLALLGGLVLHAISGVHAIPEDASEWKTLGQRFAARPHSPTMLAARGGVLVAIGALTAVRPLAVLAFAATAIGVGLLVYGARDVLFAVLRWWRSDSRRVQVERVYRPVIAVGVVVVLAGTFAYLAWPRGQVLTALTGASSGDPDGCNGYVELCDRPYNEVAFPATHNSMSAQDAPGWFIGEQPTGVMGQLRDGVRVFLVDSWFGQMSNRPPIVANTADGHAEALAAAEETYGKEVVASALRLRNAADLDPVGPVKPYLCHELCELGSTEWLPLMKQVRQWMDEHPREVVTFFVQDKVPPADVEKLLREAGLYDRLYTPTRGEPWPTLQQMIDSKRQLVWLHENVGGGTERPWLLDGNEWVQDTPYEFKTAEQFTCVANRGPADAPALPRESLAEQLLASHSGRPHRQCRGRVAAATGEVPGGTRADPELCCGGQLFNWRLV